MPQLFSRFYLQRMQNDLRVDDLVQAESNLGKAERWQPFWRFANDAKRVEIAAGELALRLTEEEKTIKGFIERTEKARQFFRTAVERDPLDIDALTGLARATAALEKVYPFAYKKDYPDSALPYFQQLLKLMPVNLYSHALLTKYYLARKMSAELHALVAQSISIYPPLYYQLIRQPFYTLVMNEMLKKALQAAIANGVYEESAYKVLADIASKEGDSSAAIEYFAKSNTPKPYQDNSGYDLQMGRLQLEAGRYEEAEQSFLVSLQTVDRESRLNEIWNTYRGRKLFNEFLGLCNAIDDERVAEQLEIVSAKSLLELGRYELAMSHLIRLDSKKYAAESLYLQAKIAEKQKDWDTMELRSQRATVLESQNADYHLLFSRALSNQKKWPQAEKAATDAIVTASRPNPWLYNHRAWIRWGRKDYPGAQEDWEQAIALSPRTPDFHYSMALVFEQAGNVEGASRQVAKAMVLKPGDSAYMKKQEQLQQKLQQ